MPDGGRTGKCSSWRREWSLQSLEAGSSKADGRRWLFIWAAAQTAGHALVEMKQQAQAGVRPATLNQG